MDELGLVHNDLFGLCISHKSSKRQVQRQVQSKYNNNISKHKYFRELYLDESKVQIR